MESRYGKSSRGYGESRSYHKESRGYYGESRPSCTTSNNQSNQAPSSSRINQLKDELKNWGR